MEHYQKTKRTEIKPQVKVGALGTEFEAGGLGTETEATRDVSKTISLSPQRKAKTSDVTIPDTVDW